MMTKGWGGPGMESSNYYWGYLRNELNWGIATYYENSMAQTFLNDALVTRWQNGVLPYFAGPDKGGVPPEGSAYGPVMLSYPVVPFTTAGLPGEGPPRRDELVQGGPLQHDLLDLDRPDQHRIRVRLPPVPLRG